MAGFREQNNPTQSGQTSAFSRHINLGPSCRHNHKQPSPPPVDTATESDLDSDIEFFPGDHPPASHSQINRFTELTSLSPKQSAKYLHQHRDLGTGIILFNEAITSFFENHDHEDDEEYVYGADGCYCLERAAERVLDKVFRAVREGLGREQGDLEVVLDGVWEVLEGERGGLSVPFLVLRAVRTRFGAVWRSDSLEVVSLHEESFMRSRINA